MEQNLHGDLIYEHIALRTARLKVARLCRGLGLGLVETALASLALGAGD